jgi:hypothetical protein
MPLGSFIRITPIRPGHLILGLVGGLAVSAFAQGETVPIRFSKPFEPVLSTNLSTLVADERAKSFQNLLRDADTHGASGLFRDRSFTGMDPPPPRPRQMSQPSQRQREAAERKKNWVFTIEEDMQNDPQVTQMLKFLDADAAASGERSRDPMLDFYDRMEQGGGQFGGGESQDGGSSESGADSNSGRLPFGAAPIGAPPGVLSTDRRSASVARPRDPISLVSRREPLSTASTRQAADFEAFGRTSAADNFTSASQRARFDAFKGLFGSKPSSVAAAPKPASASPLAGAMNQLNLPSPSFGSGRSSSSGFGGSSLPRLDIAPSWKPPAPPTSPLPGYGSPTPMVPTRGGSSFPSVPTRRQ